MILICFPTGLFAFVIPFSARIILGPQGVEFHSIAAILKANWADLTVGVIETPSGSYKTLLCSKYEVVLRNWAKYLPWDVASGLRELGIPFSQFGSFTSQSFLATIDRYAPHLKILE